MSNAPIKRWIASATGGRQVELEELDWINSRVRLLGETFGQAAQAIQNQIDAGSLVVVRKELLQ